MFATAAKDARKADRPSAALERTHQAIGIVRLTLSLTLELASATLLSRFLGRASAFKQRPSEA